MERELKDIKPDFTYVGDHETVLATGLYVFALINHTDLSVEDWDQIKYILRASVTLPENYIDDQSQDYDHAELLQDAAYSLGWISPREHIMVALRKDIRAREAYQDSSDEARSRLNLLNNAPILVPSVVNEQLRIANIEKAANFIFNNDGKIMVFIESAVKEPDPSVERIFEPDFLDDSDPVRHETINSKRSIEHDDLSFNDDTDTTIRLMDAVDDQKESESLPKNDTQKGLDLELWLSKQLNERFEAAVQIPGKTEDNVRSLSNSESSQRNNIKFYRGRDQGCQQQYDQRITSQKDDLAKQSRLLVERQNVAKIRRLEKENSIKLSIIQDLLQERINLKANRENVQVTLNSLFDRQLKLENEQASMLQYMQTENNKTLKAGQSKYSPGTRTSHATSTPRNQYTKPRTPDLPLKFRSDFTKTQMVPNTPNLKLEQQFNNSQSRSPIILKPKQFGLSEWKPELMDINMHLSKVNQAVWEARELGATESQLIRFLMRTIPETYSYLEHFIPADCQSTYEKFSSELVKTLSDRVQTQMKNFIEAQREPGEEVLRYFFRLLILYKSSNRLDGDQWMSDRCHTIAIYSKIFESLPWEVKPELTRRIEDELENNTLTIEKLKTKVTTVGKLAQRYIKKETNSLRNEINAMATSEDEEEDNEPATMTNAESGYDYEGF